MNQKISSKPIGSIVDEIKNMGHCFTKEMRIGGKYFKIEKEQGTHTCTIYADNKEVKIGTDRSAPSMYTAIYETFFKNGNKEEETGIASMFN